MIADLKNVQSVGVDTPTTGHPSLSNPVDFMIIGAQKCGTTTLADQLAGHPEICFSRIKEPGYFNEHVDWQDGLEKYHTLYARQAGQLCGEASTMYTFFPEYQGTPERLYSYNPDLKLIYIMRHPVDRVVSLYAHNFVRNIEKRAPHEAVLRDPDYVNRSRYGMQLEPYVKLFGRERILPLVFEEYIADQSSTLQTVARFLGVSPDGFVVEEESHSHKTVGTPYLKYEWVRRITDTDFFQSWRLLFPERLRHSIRGVVSNTLSQKPEFSDSLKQTLYRMLETDIERTEAILGRSIPAWEKYRY